MADRNHTAFDLSADRVFRGMAITETDENTWHDLRGVFIEPIEDGGAWIVATDGRIMLVQRDRSATAKENAILRFQAPRFQLFDDEDGPVEGDWHWCGSRISVPELALSQTVAAPVAHKSREPWLHVLTERIDGKFLDWRTPIGQPMGLPHTHHQDRLEGINVSLLDRLCGPHHGFHGVQIHGNFSDTKALLVTFGEDPDSFGLITKRKLSLSSSPLNDLLIAIGRDDLAEEAVR